MSSQNYSFRYDKANDVLYLSVGPPRPSYGEDLRDGIVARYDMDTDEMTGVTVLGFKRRVLSKDPSLLDIPMSFDFHSVPL